MPPGGCEFRRRLRTIVVAAAASASLCLPLVGTPAHAAHVRTDNLTEGHRRSGEPALPVVYPTSRRQLAGLDTATLGTKTTGVTFDDLDTDDAWARAAIRWVASDNSWMLDFRPNANGT